MTLTWQQKHAGRSLLLSLIFLLFAGTAAFAQAGSLRDQVTDENGAVVAGAKVTARGPDGAVKVTTATPSARIRLRGFV